MYIVGMYTGTGKELLRTDLELEPWKIQRNRHIPKLVLKLKKSNQNHYRQLEVSVFFFSISKYCILKRKIVYSGIWIINITDRLE